MIQSEDERTRGLISRLVALAAPLRLGLVAGWAVFFGVLVALLAAWLEPDLWWLGGLLGLLIGLVVGLAVASFFIVLLEWMAQMLVTQGEILALTKRRE